MTHQFLAAVHPGSDPGHIPLPELMCARLDGEVYPLGACWCPIDEVESPALRAASLGPLVPPRGIVERASAAWVYGVLPEPAVHELCVDVHARAHLPPSAHVHIREVTCPAADTRLLAGIRVTSPLRTAVDLARWSVETDESALTQVLGQLLTYGGFSDETEARLACACRATPHRARALARFDLVAARHRSGAL
ncbi:type IV toxin-antitoxin system AbiEi family antitoxin [Cryobacterium sp. CG_9.6]|uniref:type IV toxin-antitoxin system AbiEi family antitoxin n=1 Tax=Cryobacterium sp. CG_9.6 TaxID=2760710 RepID=UPI002473C14B|nr:type IV toxin-antitoxin system AbiEi family antitoxin [Cryobacterium sp. CG_9.6]MDH6237308.1 hypothetical protein [Cryobacterium sp. CG_9.6]